MFNKKKWKTILAVILLCIFFTACGKEKADTSTKDDSNIGEQKVSAESNKATVIVEGEEDESDEDN